MISRELGELLKPLVRNQIIIWGALTGACFLYVGIAFLIGLNRIEQRLAGAETGQLATNVSDGGSLPVDLSFLFYGIAIVLGTLAFVYNRWAMSDQRLAQRLAGEPAIAPSGLTGFGRNAALSKKYASLSVSEQKILSLVGYGMTTMIITLAICEAISILGLVLVFFKGQPLAIVPFAAVNIILNFVFMPRPVEILRQAEASIRSD